MKEETKKLSLDKLFREVVSQMAGGIAAFGRSIRDTPPSPDGCERVYGFAHSLHGSGKLYGYPCVSELGAALEKVTRSMQEARLAASPAVAGLLESSAAALIAVCEAEASDTSARDRIKNLAWECECLMHAAAAAASDPPSCAAAEPAPPRLPA